MNLLEDVERILEENDFDYAFYRGCFDIVARRAGIMLLKVSGNIDSFQEEQANNLKVLSRSLTAGAFLVGTHTRREVMEDNIIYERFSVPSVTVKTLENIVHSEVPKLHRFRGGLFAEINPGKLRERRLAAGLTQRELAEKVGITKKSVYEHEKRRMNAAYAVVKSLERMLGEITEPADIAPVSGIKTSPRGSFERMVSQDLRRLGFETSFVYQSPFNIIASERFMVFADAEEELKERRIEDMIEFSDVTEKPVIAVTKYESGLGIPAVMEREIREMKSARDIKRILKKG